MPWLPVLHTADEDVEYFARAVADDEVWVAEVEGCGAGFVAIGRELLDHTYVHPAFRQRGIGEALLAQVRRSRPEGFRLWVFQRNQQARRFTSVPACASSSSPTGGNEERAPDAQYEWGPIPAPGRAP